MKDKKTLRYVLIGLAVVVFAAFIGVILWLGTRNALPDPREAAIQALDSLGELPNPATLGVLGQGEVDGTRFGVSGNLNLQADGDGLALSLTDFTLADEEGSTDLELVLNKDAAALRLPGTLGEGWYGVDLTRDLNAQAVEAAGEELAAWYFADGKLAETQETADALRTALAEVETLGLSETDRAAIKEFLNTHGGALWREEGGYGLSLTEPVEEVNGLLETLGLPQLPLTDPVQPLDEPGNVEVFCALDKTQRLISVEVTAGDFSALLDLGDPAEPTPRLEVTWGENGANSLELAFTVAPGEAVVMPEFENAFALLSVLAAAEQ